ncbi:hypothetical protein Q0V21_18930 [Paenibacillus sp. 11B]|uniref:hypothetical protein n=1 Tax=Paenibacillus sp. 11B TaxID=3060965 RepID=UPI00265621B0|nr:hypothetical protein [Paenibacillus sp. 11B]MDN8590834.1 hypothetical protein [Paenibacillus sp. 11B]
MRKAKLIVYETIKSKHEIEVSIPDDMAEGEFGNKLYKAERASMSLEDLFFLLKKYGVVAPDTINRDPQLITVSDIDVYDYRVVEESE